MTEIGRAIGVLAVATVSTASRDGQTYFPKTAGATITHLMSARGAQLQGIQLGGIVAPEITSYQLRVEQWLEACFSPSVRADVRERTHRFLEEALELAQANGCTRDDSIALVDYVFGRPHGEPEQEVGGVMVTLAGLCSASDINMDEAGNRELERNWERIELIRAKQKAKPHGSPLPQ